MSTSSMFSDCGGNIGKDDKNSRSPEMERRF
jgi:hypothetical protein